MVGTLSKCTGKPAAGVKIPQKPNEPNGFVEKRDSDTSFEAESIIPIAGRVQDKAPEISERDFELEARMEKILKQPLQYHYKMDHLNRGLCLIFNQETFHNSNMKSRLPGTRVDRERLLHTFTALGFDVRIFDNASKRKTKRILKRVSAMNHRNNDCLAVVILSHGELIPFYPDPNIHRDFTRLLRKTDRDDVNTILSLDLTSYIHSKDTLYALQMIWSYFTDENCPSLANKPRLFFVQACKGNLTDPGMELTAQKSGSASERTSAQNGSVAIDIHGFTLEPTKLATILPQPHFLTAFSAFNGYLSFRNNETGSWFIRLLCQMLNTREKNHDLNHILTLARQAVAYDCESRSFEPEIDRMKQIPFVISSLDKLIIFPKADDENQ